MERIKQFYASAVAAVLALVFIIVGVLAVTVFKPSQEQASSAVPATDLVVTRDGVLSLLDDDVVVTATSASGADVALILGTSSDIVGWVGTDPYTEIVGIEPDRSTLKVEEHNGSSDDEAQSGADSRASQSGAEQPQSDSAQSDSAQSSSVVDPVAAALVDEVEESDMWLQSAVGAGSATLTLAQVASGRSVLAVSAGGAGDLTLTLTWEAERTNTLAIVSLLFATIFVIVAALLFFRRRSTLRDRAARAERVAGREGADITDTQFIDSAEVAALAEAERLKAAGVETSDEEDAPVSEPNSTVDDFTEAADDEPTGDEPTGDEPTGDEPTSDEPADSESADESSADASAVVPESDADEETPDEHSTPDEAAPVVRGRHGSSDGPIDEDPPERVPTGSGIIDLSAIRPGAALPTRRALREAREKGEEKLIIDGHEFDTGLIPIVSRKNNDEESAPQSTEDAAAEENGGWKSLMSGWLDRSEKEDR